MAVTEDRGNQKNTNISGYDSMTDQAAATGHVFPRSHRSSVGTHTNLVSTAKVRIPTEDRGNQKRLNLMAVTEDRGNQKNTNISGYESMTD
ncbi:hypothetical protein [Methylotuvimicrobium sp. KM2]|uniref:hypothetical protein n=1 Tax=Methylotuvimicrobium sp. KM2 TaxID=3133976 RepID=UPI003100B644